jgi:hypothetical protein
MKVCMEYRSNTGKAICCNCFKDIKVGEMNLNIKYFKSIAREKGGRVCVKCLKKMMEVAKEIKIPTKKEMKEYIDAITKETIK